MTEMDNINKTPNLIFVCDLHKTPRYFATKASYYIHMRLIHKIKLNRDPTNHGGR